MKHLVIILSVLLLSSPLFGQETSVLYQYETSTGIKWKTFGDGKVQPKYKGEIKNGVMDGLGVLIYPFGEKSVVGEWKNGEEWNTKHKNKDGRLIGKFENGEWIEVETLYRGGQWGDYKWMVLGNKDIHPKYQGQVKDGKPNGLGILTYVEGGKYVGSWLNGKWNGQGTRTWDGGRKYVGKWKYNKQWNGIYYEKNGNIIGKYVNGKLIKP